MGAQAISVAASPDIEAWAREPFEIGRLHDSPADAAERMGREIVGPASEGVGMNWALIAQSHDGRRFRVDWTGRGCVAQEIADDRKVAA